MRRALGLGWASLRGRRPHIARGPRFIVFIQMIAPAAQITRREAPRNAAFPITELPAY